MDDNGLRWNKIAGGRWLSLTFSVATCATLSGFLGVYAEFDWNGRCQFFPPLLPVDCGAADVNQLSAAGNTRGPRLELSASMTRSHCLSSKVLLFEAPVNVNPGLINPKRLVNWGGTIEVLDEMTIGGVQP